ncbi:MAG: hypothetical protein KQH63_20010 [Desulfobulbaceae bacterium]|nr:hypothetical protein [Desulfobulbaceae bacterium]
MSGIDNIYSDEILFLMGLPPCTKVKDLDENKLHQLAVKTRHILTTAVDRKAGENGRPQRWLLPRRRERKSCPRCLGTISRISVSGRSAYYCPDHQRV